MNTLTGWLALRHHERPCSGHAAGHGPSIGWVISSSGSPIMCCCLLAPSACKHAHGCLPQWQYPCSPAAALVAPGGLGSAAGQAGQLALAVRLIGPQSPSLLWGCQACWCCAVVCFTIRFVSFPGRRALLPAQQHIHSLPTPAHVKLGRSGERANSAGFRGCVGRGGELAWQQQETTAVCDAGGAVSTGSIS